MIDIGLYIMYVLMGVAIVSAIGLPILSALKSPASLVRSLYSVGALVILFVISYALSSSSVTTNQAALGITEGTSKLVGAGLIMFYIVAVVAVIGLVFSEINKAFK